MYSTRLSFISLFLLTATLSLTGQEIRSLDISQLDEYIETARQQWNVPGLSVTVVKDGKTLLAKGYGVRSIHTQEPVDAQTLFMLGSTTKAMTAAAMAMLVDEGVVSWHDKVIDHLPWFRLHDPYVANELTIKDLFTHNSGVGNADLLWVLWDYSTEEIVRRMSNLPLSYSMRGGYTYQNIMYATAGLVIEKASGQDWDRFIHQRLFEPLGMNKSCALKACAETFENRTKPHYPTDDGIIQIIDSNADSIGSAGSAWSCPEDIQKWMNFVLDSAVVNGKRLISKENFEILHSPHIIIPRGSFYPTTELTKPHFTAYSLGWFLHDYKGEYVQFHTGSLNGSGAIIGMIPDHNLAVYVMVNLDHAEVRHAIMYKVFDFILGLGDRDWSTDLFRLYSKRNDQGKMRREKLIASRIPNAPSNIPAQNMTGTYENAYLGILTITNSNEELIINCRPDRHISLDHWHNNTFLGRIVEYEHDTGDLIDFDVDAMGNLSFTLFGYEFAKKR